MAGWFTLQAEVKSRSKTPFSHGQANFSDGESHAGGETEAIRLPLADSTLVKLPVAADATRMPSLLTLSDVLGTGHHAAIAASVTQGARWARQGSNVRPLA